MADPTAPPPPLAKLVVAILRIAHDYPMVPDWGAAHGYPMAQVAKRRKIY